MDPYKKVSILTRRDFKCPIFGNPRDLLPSKLPTFEDVIYCCFDEQLNLAIAANNKSVPFSKVSGIVSEKIKSLWNKASIQTVIRVQSSTASKCILRVLSQPKKILQPG